LFGNYIKLIRKGHKSIQRNKAYNKAKENLKKYVHGVQYANGAKVKTVKNTHSENMFKKNINAVIANLNSNKPKTKEEAKNYLRKALALYSVKYEHYPSSSNIHGQTFNKYVNPALHYYYGMYKNVKPIPSEGTSPSERIITPRPYKTTQTPPRSSPKSAQRSSPVAELSPTRSSPKSARSSPSSKYSNNFESDTSRSARSSPSSKYSNNFESDTSRSARSSSAKSVKTSISAPSGTPPRSSPKSAQRSSPVAELSPTRRNMAAKKIQRLYKGFKARKEFLKMKQAAKKIQRLYKGFKARKEFKREQAAKKIQRAFRRQPHRLAFGSANSPEELLNKLFIRGSSKQVQPIYRELIGRSNRFKGLPNKVYGSFEEDERRERNIEKMEKKIIRGFEAAGRQLDEKKIIRGFEAAGRQLDENKRSALLQKFLFPQMERTLLRIAHPGNIELSGPYRKIMRNKAAQEIQRLYKGFKVRKEFLKMKQAAKIIQSRFRTRIEKIKARRSYLDAKTRLNKLEAAAREAAAREARRAATASRLPLSVLKHIKRIGEVRR